ncbi:MAG TPA: nuclear transport factor 2 family protein [Solirubrobacteraceae bacterium]|nr:nuclear transport factor 2 family protein [Solirubrobacteraceae bacterium]
MSQENVEIVRTALLAGFVSKPPDVEALREVLDPDCVLTTNWGVEGAEHHGVEGALAAVAEMSGAWESWAQEVERVLDAGDERVVALLRLRATGRGSAVPVEFQWATVATLRNGKIVTSRVFLSQADALKAVGLEE